MLNKNISCLFTTVTILAGCASGGGGGDGGGGGSANDSLSSSPSGPPISKNFGNVYKGTSFGSAGRLGSVYQADLEGPGSKDQIIVGRQSAGQSGTEISVLSWNGSSLVNNTAKWFPGGSNRIVGSEPSVQFADFFKSGRTDMFVATDFDAPSPGNSQLYRNVGGSFQKIVIESKAWGHGSDVYDLNGDGFKDIVITDYGPNTTFAINNGVNGFTSLVQRNPNGGIYTASSIAAGDFLGNGSVSLVATDMGVNRDRTTLHSFSISGGGVDAPLITDLPSSRFQLPKWASAGFGETLSSGRRVSHDVRALNFDFNSDGRPDIIVMSRPWLTNGQWPQYSEIQFLKNNGGGSFTDVTDSVVSGYNTSMPVSYNPRFVDLNGDGMLDILLPQQQFGGPNGTQLLLRTSSGQYVAAFTQIFNEFGAAASAAGSTGPNGNVITMVNAPNGKTYLMSVNLQGAAYLSEVGSTGTISAAGLDSLIRGTWPWLSSNQVTTTIQKTSVNYNGYTVIDADAAMKPYGQLGIPNGNTTASLRGGISGVKTGDLNVVGIDSLGRTFKVDMQPLYQVGLNSFQRNTEHLDQHTLTSHAEYLVNGPVNTAGNLRIGSDNVAPYTFNGMNNDNGYLIAPQQAPKQYTLGIPSIYKNGNWNMGMQYTNLASNPFLAMSGTFGAIKNSGILDHVVTYRHESGFSASASLMHVSTNLSPGVVTNVSNMIGTWGEAGYRFTDWKEFGDVGFYAGVKPYILSGNVTANMPTSVDNQGNTVYSKRSMSIQNSVTTYARAMYSTFIAEKTMYRASGTYMANGQYRIMHELRYFLD